ncbi:hypothetical protein JZY06_00690 [Corynebacterium sp. CCM 8862]|uniref:Swt1-like HEPN domain-containing protein n=1 Tax=Corynebacterium mendelii TaxID=2765362 RepID=A0A939DYI3_9CORY|nr:hypothetical protein [Corynebacterium mendelii]
MQQRMITESLGRYRYPFSTGGGTIVSSLGSELRTVRNRWAHHDTFDELEAFRTADSVVTLLKHFGDREGKAAAEKIRDGAFRALVPASGVLSAPPE